jgi:regulator of sirC expression with transglutaminase-like and TPR domain
MTIDFEFHNDTEFRKLLRRSPDVDLTLVALELARDGQPSLDFGHTLDWISRRAEEVRNHLVRARSDRAMLRELSRCLSGTHGLHGDKEAFHRAESSYINRVIETGVGIPISLSLVYVAVAQRAGAELEGVAAPMHFLARLEGIEGPLFVDAFHQGEVLSYSECCTWLETLSGMAPEDFENALEPARPRDIVIRMLNNLKALQVKQEQWDQTWHVQRRLAALHPGVYEHRRDLALVALKSNHPGPAIDLLEDCLKVCPRGDRPVLQGHLLSAERLLADRN